MMSGRNCGGPEYDPILAWQPLAENATRVLGPGLGDQGILKLGAFGTCGNPKSPDYISWRHAELFPILEGYGIEPDSVFNPEVEEWKPEDAEIESIHLARDHVVAVAVTNQTESPASIMEAGFAAFGGVLRGQDAIVYMAADERSPQKTRRARQLGKNILSATAARYPLFTMADSVSSLSHIAAVRFRDRLVQQESGMVPRIERVLPPRRRDLAPVVNLSGTCGPVMPEWMNEVESTVRGRGVPVKAGYSKNWDPAEELTHKMNDAVQLIAITGETDSFGALAELGPFMMHAYIAGQSLGIFIEDHPSGPTSQTNRTRTLAKAHLNRLLSDFPELPIFIADDLSQLATFGLSEYYEQRQRLQRV